MKLRWRGQLNMKDVTERVIAGIATGLVIGITLGVFQLIF